MGAERKSKSQSNVIKLVEKKERESRAALTPEARESQLVNLAVELAEQQLRDGTASAAVMTHFLKLGTKKEHLERQILEKQSALIEAKASSLNKDKDSDSLAREAIEALKGYTSSQ